jgi:pimeloyl-ACP methyl ester carboxylesterase
MGKFEDRSWTSGDGLKLHFRDYPCADAASDSGPAARAPVICIPGLTRNARDFEDLAPRLAQHRRVLCVDLRGRGNSDYARDPMTYVPTQYVTDIEALLAQEQIARFVSIGTSLGGLVTMLMAWADQTRIAGAVINDIGPEIEPAGLARIRDYVGQGRAFETWMHGAWALQESQAETYPDFDLGDWLRMAKRTMALGSGGRVAFDYDMNIADPIEAAPADAPAPDLWPAWHALAKAPLLLLRGERSDILAAHSAARMIDEAPGATLVTVPRVGHAPTLDEPVSVAAIEALLARVD